MTAQYEYDAFGELLDTSDTPDTNYLYTGQQYDPMSELYSLRARYYNPVQGRFLSRDEWAYNFQNPLELNRYVYTANNPVNYTDPSGNARALLETAQILKSAAIQAIQPVTSIGHFPLIAIGVTAVAFTCILLECWEWPGQAVEILNNLLQNHVEDQIDWEALFEEAGNAASWIIDLFARMLSNSAGRETGNESANENAEDVVDDAVDDIREDENEDDNPRFFYRDVGFVWRETGAILDSLRPYESISGIIGLANNLSAAQARYNVSNNNINYWFLAGRKMEAERAIVHGRAGRLVSASPNSAPDFAVRNVPGVGYIEVKWTSVDYLHMAQQQKIENAIQNAAPSLVLVEYNQIGSGLRSDLENIGGREYPY